ncbi:hypothetical protein ACIGKR_17750 [Rhodococcus qingshengii]|uniref:hypothetical protein n=1 Tax=Rhodococcus qingshengii TaxID=334542 RepID=UPI0037C92394
MTDETVTVEVEPTDPDILDPTSSEDDPTPEVDPDPTPEQIWATHYLEHDAIAETLAAKKGVRAAERALREALAEQPWVVALIDLATARHQSSVIADTEQRAHSALGSEAPVRSSMSYSLASWFEGSPSADFLLRPLLTVVDGTAEQRADQQREERRAAVDALIANEQQIAALAEQSERDAELADSDPIARVRFGGGRMEVHEVDIRGTTYTRHRNIDTNASVIVDADGNVYVPPPQTVNAHLETPLS